MEALFAVTLGVLSASGVYLLLRGRTFPVVLGLIAAVFTAVALWGT